jgi:endogenous inhibitor of DNA gyrase (YacG/DUF329 family)
MLEAALAANCSGIRRQRRKMIRPQTCPICDKELPADARARSLFPFCSERCRRIDFFRWAEGRYAIVEPLDPKDLPRIELDGEDE